MITINRVYVTKHSKNKIDFTGHVPSSEDNANVKTIDLEKNTCSPITAELSTGNTTLKFTNNVNNKNMPKSIIKAGTYSSSTFTEGGSDVTYHMETIGNTVKITGTVKYVSANAEVSLPAGNHVILRIAKSNITDDDYLPTDDVICKVTHTGKDGGYNVAGKSAFESDGSLIVAVLLNDPTSMDLTEPREVMIAWEKKDNKLVWTRYILDFSGATLGAQA